METFIHYKECGIIVDIRWSTQDTPEECLDLQQMKWKYRYIEQAILHDHPHLKHIIQNQKPRLFFVSFEFYIFKFFIFYTAVVPSQSLVIGAFEGRHVFWFSARGSSIDLRPLVAVWEDNSTIFVFCQHIFGSAFGRKVNELYVVLFIILRVRIYMPSSIEIIILYDNVSY